MCGQHNVRASTGDNTGQNTMDTLPIPGRILKFLTPLGIEPGPTDCKAGTLQATPRRLNSIKVKKKVTNLSYLYF